MRRSVSRWQRFFDFGSGAPGNTLMLTPFGGTGSLASAVSAGAAQANFTSAFVLPNDDAWRHFVVSIKASGAVSMYVNGADASTMAYNGAGNVRWG